MSKKTLKYILNVLLLVIILTATFILLFRNTEMEVIFEQIKNAKKGFLYCGIAMMGIFVCSESVIIYSLFKNFKINFSIRKSLLISCIGFFFCSITPGASGGQPIQIYYLSKCGVDTLVSTLVVMIITVFYKIALLLLCVLFLIFRTATMIDGISEVPVLFMYGFIGNALFLGFLLMVIYKPSMAFKIVSLLIKFGGKLKILKNPNKILRKAIKSIRKYEKCTGYLKKNLSIIPRIIIITLIQRTAFFTIGFLVYKALGLSGTDWGRIVALQIVLSLAVDVLPLPGAAGANESVYVLLYRKIFGEVAVFSGLLINRGITFYALILVTSIITMCAHIYITKNSNRFIEEHTVFSLKRLRLLKNYKKDYRANDNVNSK